MGLLDDVLGKVKKAVGGTGVEESNLVNEVPGILPGAGEGGGLQGLIQTLTDKGSCRPPK